MTQDETEIDLQHLRLGALSIVRGDLSLAQADVLVNEADNHLQMTGGVSGALRARGGIAIHLEAIGLGPLPVGRVVRAGAGELGCASVHHAVVIDYVVGRGMSTKVIASVMGDVLAMADEDGAETVCFPLFGAGGTGLPLQASLEAMIDGLEEAGCEGGGRQAIRLFVRDPDEFEEIRSLARDLEAGAGRRQEESDVAEGYHQQFLAKNPGGYCGLGGTGVSCPVSPLSVG